MRLKLSVLLLLCAPACALDTEEVEQDVSWEHDGNFGATMLDTDGIGFGWANVHSFPNETGTFSAVITVQLIRVSPNTTYTLQRAPEVGRVLGADGICQRAAGVFPWEGAPSYVTFIIPATDTTPAHPVTITTNPGGHGFVRFEFNAPAILAGATFDVQFRAISTSATSIVSDCFQVTPQ